MIGGYPTEKSVLVTGTAGSGKTIMALHFLNAALAQGLKCVYLATEEIPEDIKRQSLCFGWPLDEYERKGTLQIINVLKRRVLEAREAAKYGSKVEVTNFMPFYNKIPADSDVVIIDNIGSLAIGMSPDVLRHQLDLLVYKLNEIGATSLIICDEALGEQTFNIAMYSVYGAIRLMRRENPFTNKRERVMDVIKLRSTKIPIDFIHFDISEKGLFLVETEM